MRRHYLSQHLEKSAFGYGWKMSGIPSLTLSSDGTTLTVEEADHTLFTYTQDPNNQNRWIPRSENTPPPKSDTTVESADTIATFITKQTTDTQTHYTYHGLSGDKRTYKITNGGTSSQRALLEKWEDKNGNHYTFQYGENSQEPNYHQLTKILSSTGSHIDITYNPQGQITQIATEKENLQYTYNAEEDLIQITRTENNKTLQATYQYQQTKPTEQTEEILQSTHRLLQEKKPDGRILENEYDSAGRLTAQKTTTGEPAAPKSHTHFTYPTEDNKNTIGSRTRNEYENGLLTKTTDPLGNKTSYYYQDSGNPTLPTRIETKAQGETLFNIRNTYYPADPNSEQKTSGLLQKQQITEADQLILENNYNLQSLLTSQKEITGTTDPDLLTQFEYNTSGEHTKQIDDLGISIYNHDSEKKQILIERRDKADNLLTSQTFHYNDNGQPEKIEQLGTEPTSYKYDAKGNLTEISSPKSDLIKLTYDARGQILSRTSYNQTDDSKISGENFTYEPGGQIASYTNSKGEETKYTYTTDGKLKRQENPDGTTQEWLYQLDGRLVKQTLADGSYWETAYNDIEQTLTRTKKNTAGETLKEETYTFDKRGNITSYTDEKNQTTTRQYDKLNRLIAEIGSPATAEATQRRTNIAYSGNTTTITNELGEKLILTKDDLGRITSILNQDANSQTLFETTYNYSTEKSSETTDSESSTTTVPDAKKDSVNWTELAEKFGKQAILAALTVGQAGNLHTANKFAMGAIPFSMAFGAASFAAKLMRFNTLGSAFDTVSEKAFELVVNNWNVANQGPLGKLFDKQIYGTTPLLRPLIGPNNQQFLAHWATGNSPAIIKYASDSPQSREMQKSPGAEAIINIFYAGNAKTRKDLYYDTPAAYRDTLLTHPANWKSTAMQVGGFGEASAINNGDGTVTFRITNIAGAKSFFYHAVPNLRSTTGPMHNIEQIFEWTEPIDSSRLPKN